MAFYKMIEDHDERSIVQGQRTVTLKVLKTALRGYRSAFPEELTLPGVQRAIEAAANRCSDSFVSFRLACA